MPALFNLVERPAEPDVVAQMKEEAKEPRQEAVVKGITPPQPAPNSPIEPAATTPVAAAAGGHSMAGWRRFELVPHQASDPDARRSRREAARQSRCTPRRPGPAGKPQPRTGTSRRSGSARQSARGQPRSASRSGAASGGQAGSPRRRSPAATRGRAAAGWTECRRATA